MSREALDSSNVYDFLCSRASNVEMEGLVMGLQIENRRLIADLNERFKAGLTKIWENLSDLETLPSGFLFRVSSRP